MRKILASILALCMIVSFASAISESEKKEIVFRGIPWGTSATDFLSAMQEADLGGHVRTSSYLYSWENGTGRDADDSIYTLADAGYYYYTYDDTVVAGVPVNAIYAYFMYSYDNDNLFTDEDASQLYYAYYDFNPVDIASAASLLEEKLTGLYGTGKKASDTSEVTVIGGNNYTQYMDMVTWYGENNTALRMYVEHRFDKVTKETEYKTLKLFYGKSNSVELLTALKDAIAKDEVKKMQSDDSTDGL